MLRLGGLAKGNMQQCVDEINAMDLPAAFKLKQIQSLLRYLREVNSLAEHVKADSGFEGDTASYFDILCAKEDADLVRRVSHTKVLRQDFDEKRNEWRKQKRSVINAIGAMTSRALKFEHKERRAVALYALEYYKNIMGRDDGAILGESESTDSLVEQYRRHRDEISKIPMYADNIVKMLNTIRKTVRASAKFQPGANAFELFLDEWWASVVQFLQHSSIVDAEKNAREVMQTLKKLKDKQEENKKKEMTRLLAKLDNQAGVAPPSRRISEIFLGPSDNPEDTNVAMWRDELRASRSPRRIPQPALQYTERPRGSGDYSSPREGTGDLVVYGTQAPSTLQPPHLSTCMKGCGSTNSIPSLSVTVSPSADSGGTMSGTGSGGRFGTGSGSGPGGFNTVSFECDEGRSSRNSVLSAASAFSCWEDGSVCTTGMSSVGRPSSGSMMSADAGNMRAVSGIPRSSSSDEDMGHDDDHDDDIFEPANNLDLGAVDLCATGKDPDGQVTYGDTDELRPPLPPPVVVQDEVRLPLTVTGANGSSSSSNSRKLKFNRSSSLGSNSNSNSRSQRNNVDDNGNSNDGNPKFHRSCSMGSNSNYRSHRNNVEDNSNGNDGTPKKDVEKARFSAALCFFRQEQQRKGKGRIVAPRSPIRGRGLKFPPSPLACSSTNTHTNLKVRGPTPRTRRADPRVSPTKGRVGSTRILRAPSARGFASDRGRSGGKDAFTKTTDRKLSLYIPRSQKTGVAPAAGRASKIPSARLSKRPTTMGLSPVGGSCRFARNAFFA